MIPNGHFTFTLSRTYYFQSILFYGFIIPIDQLYFHVFNTSIHSMFQNVYSLQFQLSKFQIIHVHREVKLDRL